MSLRDYRRYYTTIQVFGFFFFKVCKFSLQKVSHRQLQCGYQCGWQHLTSCLTNHSSQFTHDPHPAVLVKHFWHEHLAHQLYFEAKYSCPVHIWAQWPPLGTSIQPYLKNYNNKLGLRCSKLPKISIIPKICLRAHQTPALTK